MNRGLCGLWTCSQAYAVKTSPNSSSSSVLLGTGSLIVNFVGLFAQAASILDLKVLMFSASTILGSRLFHSLATRK